MAWIYLVIASFGEIFGVASINMYIKKRNIFWFVMMVVTFSFGFVFLRLAMNDLPLGTAYAIWTGLGASGAVLMGIVVFKESASIWRIVFLICIISGAVGLKLFQ